MKRYCRMLIGGMAGLGLAVCALGQAPEGGEMGKPPMPGGQEEGAQGMHGRRLRGPEGEQPEGAIAKLIMNPKLAQDIGLTQEQITTLRTALEDMKKKEIDLRAELEKGGIDQAKLMSETNIDEKAIMAAVEKAGKISTEFAKLRVQQLILIRKTLTPEQMEKVKEMIHQRMSKMKSEEGARPLLQGRGNWGKNRAGGAQGNLENPAPPPGAPVEPTQ